MKKLMITALLLAFVMSLTSCGSSEAQSSEEERPLTEQEIIQQKIEANFSIRDEDINLIQFEEPAAGADVAVIETTLGTIKVVLFPDLAPNAVASFREIASAGKYDGQKLSRILPNYLIQSGGASGTTSFKNEYSLDLWHFRGALGMVNSAGGTNGNQFYIIQNNGLTQDIMTEMKENGFPKSVQEKYNKLGGAPWMDGKYTVFGQVIEGMQVVDTIAVTANESMDASSASSSAASAQAAAASSQADNAVVITKVTLEKYSGVSTSDSSPSTAAG